MSEEPVQNIQFDDRARPFGLSLIAILYALYSVLSIIILLTLWNLLPGAFSQSQGGELLIAVLLAESLVGFVLCFGLWKLQLWAYWAAIIISTLDILWRVFGSLIQPLLRDLGVVFVLPFQQGELSPTELLIVVIELIIIMYLAMHREIFDQGPIPEEALEN